MCYFSLLIIFIRQLLKRSQDFLSFWIKISPKTPILSLDVWEKRFFYKENVIWSIWHNLAQICSGFGMDLTQIWPGLVMNGTSLTCWHRPILVWGKKNSHFYWKFSCLFSVIAYFIIYIQNLNRFSISQYKNWFLSFYKTSIYILILYPKRSESEFWFSGKIQPSQIYF